MPLIRSQIVQIVRPSDPPRDYCVNAVYHTIAAGGFDPSVDYQNHANEMRDLFGGQATGSGSTFHIYLQRDLIVKVYDMADAKPRPIRATAIYTPAVHESAALGPREVSVCLSYYGTRNLPRERGRIFIGPIQLSNLAETVPSAIRDELVDLGHGLFDIGGENVAHVVHSPTANTDTVVQNYWCNDLWDTMRSREEKEGARTRLAP